MSIRARAALRLPAAAVAAIIGRAAPAGAHGFGQRYDLPLPLSLYLVGAAAAVVFSFVIVGLFVRRARPDRGYPRLDLLSLGFFRRLTRPGLVLALKLLAVVVFGVTVLAGFLGNQDPYQNIAPTMVWIVWWVGLAYVSAFVANLWALINPWGTLFDGAEWFYRRLARQRAPPLRLRYPAALGIWPGCLLLLAFSWVELVYPNPAAPRDIAWFAVAYSVIAWTGMALFGRAAWIRNGEVFALVFGVFARLAPMDIRIEDGPGGRVRQWALRPFGAGLLDGEPVSVSLMAFVLLLLSTVLYDGALGTPQWAGLEAAAVFLMPGLGEGASLTVRTAGLIGFWLAFLGAFIAVGAVMSAAARGRRSPLDMARDFAFTLVPIALGYHLAHYLLYLLIQGQYIVPLVSDPFGYGWNLFGTAGYRVDIGIVGARFAWYAAVTAIVLGHIAAVYLAHVKATRVIGDRGTALRCQVPLTALMVVYTLISLSIIAEPITERRATAEVTGPAEIAVPADALLPELGSGRLIAVGPGELARVKLTYRVLGSAFHDGTRMSVADLLYAFMFAYRWSDPGEAAAAHYDPVVAAATAPLRARLKGFRVVGVDTASKSFRVGDFNLVRELFVIEIYAAITPEDPDQDAAYAPPWSTLPWPVIVLMEEAVSRGWAAFSQEEARRRAVEWLDLVRSPSMNARLAILVDEFARQGYRPEALRALVSADDARKHWAALAAFYKEHGHFLVTNGPYQLKSWSADGVTLEAFRDLSYPLGVGSFDAYAVPRRGYITRMEAAGGHLKIFGDIETLMKFQRSYRLLREPMASIAPEVLARSAPECRYVVVDGEGKATMAGLARPGDNATFSVAIDGKLLEGNYTLLAEIVVNGNAMNAEIQRFPFSVP